MQDILSQESLESIFRVNAKTKTVQWQALLNDNSRDSREAIKLAADVAAGKFDVAGSRLPVDFHQFYAIFRDKTNDPTWMNSLNAEHGITHDWAFNCIVSNYPVVSFSEHFAKFVQTINRHTYFPSANSLRLLVEFYLTFPDPEQNITCNRPDSLKKAYVEWLGVNKSYRRYKHMDVVDKQNCALSFFNNKLSPGPSGVEVNYNGRIYYPLVPIEFVTTTKNFFQLTDLIFILR